MKRFFTCIVVFSAVLIGVVVFLSRFSTPVAPSIGISSIDSIGVFLSMQANQYSLLQIHLVVLSIIVVMITIILAIAAIWGYAEIKDQIGKALNKKIDDEVPALARETLVKMGTEELARRVVEAQIEVAKKENFKEAFREGITEMLGGSDHG